MTRLTPEMLLRAYAVGLFPMAEHRDDPTLYWIDPEKRGVLPLDDSMYRDACVEPFAGASSRCAATPRSRM